MLWLAPQTAFSYVCSGVGVVAAIWGKEQEDEGEVGERRRVERPPNSLAVRYVHTCRKPAAASEPSRRAINVWAVEDRVLSGRRRLSHVSIPHSVKGKERRQDVASKSPASFLLQRPRSQFR